MGWGYRNESCRGMERLETCPYLCVHASLYGNISLFPTCLDVLQEGAATCREPHTQPSTGHQHGCLDVGPLAGGAVRALMERRCQDHHRGPNAHWVAAAVSYG